MRNKPLLCGLLVVLAYSSPEVSAQSNCDEGNGQLNPARPPGLPPHEIIQKFAENEALFRQARDNYTYTVDLTVQTLGNSNTVDGELRQVVDITYDDKGNRVEHFTYRPPSTLNRVKMTEQDWAELDGRNGFAVTTDDLPRYDILYIGMQHVDEIDTYVFGVTPKRLQSGYFQGRIWVDDHDYQIVKTCGRSVTQAAENQSLTFVTYREQIDGQYWFPTYARADEVLHFKNGDVHVRGIVKFTRYQRFGSKTRIIFPGEAPDKKPH